MTINQFKIIIPNKCKIYNIRTLNVYMFLLSDLVDLQIKSVSGGTSSIAYSNIPSTPLKNILTGTEISSLHSKHPWKIYIVTFINDTILISKTMNTVYCLLALPCEGVQSILITFRNAINPLNVQHEACQKYVQEEPPSDYKPVAKKCEKSQCMTRKLSRIK